MEESKKATPLGGPGTGLPVNRVDSSGNCLKEVDKTFQHLSCRLCASESRGELQDNNTELVTGWIPVSRRCSQDTETVALILKRLLPEGLLVTLPNESLSPHICSSCYSDIQSLKNFFDKIGNGQKKLVKLYQHLKVGTVNASLMQQRKRGRPRKDAVSKNETKQVLCQNINIEERKKRASRPPTRYGREFHSNIVSPKGLEMETNIDANVETDEKGEACGATNDNNQAMQTEVLPAINTDISLLQQNLDAESNKMSEKSNQLSITNSIENVEDEHDDHTTATKAIQSDHDPNFKLYHVKTRKRKRPGRPKKIKQKDFQCDLCDKVYTAYSSLVYHKLSHHENKRDFKCSECEKQFSHKALLANHMFTHSSVKTFMCEETDCNHSFKTRSSLYNHMRIAHELKGEKLFTCEICGIQLGTKSTLQAHNKIHTGKKPFSCNYCDKRFNHRGNLNEHIRSHTKEKPYKCHVSECAKSFTTASQLRNHKTRHLGEKPFLCSECGKGFSQNAGLIIHMKSHGEELLECPTCQKQFSDSVALKKHQRLHSGETPFQCDVNKIFRDPSNLSKHRKTHLNLSYPACGSKKTNKKRKPALISLLSTKSSANPETVELGPSENDMDDNVPTKHENLQTDTNQVAESLVQILTQEELEALGGGTSSDEGNIFLYQPDDLFSISVEESPPLVDAKTEDGGTVVLQEVIAIGDLNTLTIEPH